MLTRRLVLAAPAAAGFSTAACSTRALPALADTRATPAEAPPEPTETDPSFAAFLAGVRRDAALAGVSAPVLAAALEGVQPSRRVLALDRSQPEFKLTWEHYRATRVSSTRIAAGRTIQASSAALLAEVERRYGVAPGIVLGIWGLETNYGGFTGGFNVVAALATLAWDGRRAGYFRGELIAALLILQHGDVSADRMLGSYAGALGQPQFMPSSFDRYAVDFDGDGHRDIWNSRADVLASIANYLALNGWRAGQGWGVQVRLPPGPPAGTRRGVAEWSRAGARTLDGGRLRGDWPATLLRPGGGEAFLAYPNFAAIRRYNPSDFYALAVGLLGDRVVG